MLALRLVVGHAVSAPPREMLGEMMQHWSDDERIQLRKEADERNLAYWKQLDDLGLGAELTPLERLFADDTILTMSPQDQIDFSWRMEALQVLMWSLHLLAELPPYGELAPMDLLSRAAAVAAKELIKEAKLRSADEIQAARGLAEMWHWRSRTRELIESGQQLSDPRFAQAGIHGYDDIVRRSAKIALEAGKPLEVVDEDWSVGGTPYRDLPVEEWGKVRSISVERHFALNWLCGLAPDNDWDRTPTET